MSKLHRLGKLSGRFGSNTHKPESAYEENDPAKGEDTERSSRGLPPVLDAGARATERLKTGSAKARDGATQFSRKASSKVVDTTTATATSVSNVTKKAMIPTVSHGQNASRRMADVTASARRFVGLDATVSVARQLTETTPALLASKLSEELNKLLQGMVKGSPTIYDKAMDARYIADHIGGGNHRMFDGSHTILGAFRAAREAPSNDNIFQEAWGTILGLLRDGTTPKGLPIRTWDPGTYKQVSDWLNTNLGIPKDWFNDLNSYDAAELLGSAIGVVALIFSWNRADTETFAKLVGSWGVSAAVSANPLLLLVTVVALARAFQKAHQTGEYAEFVDGQLKGGIGAGVTLSAVALVGVAGGPVGVPLLVGLTTGILVNAATKNVSVVEVSQFVAKKAVVAAKQTMEGLRDTQVSPDSVLPTT